jgi:hypothetical protein
VVIWFISSRFGKLYEEKYGNPGFGILVFPPVFWYVLPRIIWQPCSEADYLWSGFFSELQSSLA